MESNETAAEKPYIVLGMTFGKGVWQQDLAALGWCNKSDLSRPESNACGECVRGDPREGERPFLTNC